jgi:hypothetical protein
MEQPQLFLLLLLHLLLVAEVAGHAIIQTIQTLVLLEVLVAALAGAWVYLRHAVRKAETAA